MKLTAEQELQRTCLQWLALQHPNVFAVASMNGMSLGDARKNPAIYGYVAKMKECGMKRGFPDLQLFWPDGRVLFVEMKAPKEKPEPHQLEIHDMLRRLGHAVAWTGSLDGFQTIVNEFAHHQHTVA